MAKATKGHVLYLTHEEAEVLREYLDHTIKFGAEMDPLYEDWDWLKTKGTLQGIADVLPEAI